MVIDDGHTVDLPGDTLFGDVSNVTGTVWSDPLIFLLMFENALKNIVINDKMEKIKTEGR